MPEASAATPASPMLPHEHEAVCIGRALIGETPSSYVIAQYERAHLYLALDPVTPLDDLLVELAARDPLATRVAEAYARVFAPGGALRRKCTTMAAILESSVPSDTAFEPETGRLHVVVGLLAAGATFAAALGAGVVIIGPLHAALLLGWEGA